MRAWPPSCVGPPAVTLACGFDSREHVGLDLLACQATTAAAHADDYKQYPVVLLRSLSYDLRRSLSDAIVVVRTL